MADISKITLPTGTTYNIKDQGARDLIAELLNYTTYLGVTTTALSDGATTNPITVNGSSVTATQGCIATYQNNEFIFNGSAWQKFGDLSGLGALAYKDTASGSGTVAVPKTYTTTVTPAAKNVSVTGTPSGTIATTYNSTSTDATGNFTPAGTIATTYNSTSTNATGNFTPAGSVTVTPSTTTKYVAASATGGGSVTAGSAASCTLPSFTTSVANETLTLGWSAGSFTANTPTSVTLPSFSSQTIATGISSASFSGTKVYEHAAFTGTKVYEHAAFTGSSTTSTGSYTPATPTATTTTATTENKTVSITVS